MYFPAADVLFSEEVIAFEGGRNAFSCTSDFGTTVEWLVNGTHLEEPYPMGVTIETIGVGGSLTFNNVSLDYNGTTVQCIANNKPTNIGTLLVQGKDTLRNCSHIMCYIVVKLEHIHVY